MRDPGQSDITTLVEIDLCNVKGWLPGFPTVFVHDAIHRRIPPNDMAPWEAAGNSKTVTE